MNLQQVKQKIEELSVQNVVCYIDKRNEDQYILYDLKKNPLLRISKSQFEKLVEHNYFKLMDFVLHGINKKAKKYFLSHLSANYIKPALKY